jgi:hypothetical protein
VAVPSGCRQGQDCLALKHIAIAQDSAFSVFPAMAGIQGRFYDEARLLALDSRFRGNDGKGRRE